jgi:hypothetical protein
VAVADPYWLVYTDDDLDNIVRAPDEATAIRIATEDGTVDPAVVQMTPDELREMANADRRERYAAKEHPSRAKPASEAAQAWYATLGMGAALSLYDEQGRCRCPQCRRFCTLDDFAGAPTAARGAGICLDFDPTCKRCRRG